MGKNLEYILKIFMNQSYIIYACIENYFTCFIYAHINLIFILFPISFFKYSMHCELNL